MAVTISSKKETCNFSDTSGSYTISGNATLNNNVVESLSGNIVDGAVNVNFNYGIGTNINLTMNNVPSADIATLIALIQAEVTSINNSYSTTTSK